MPRPFSPKAFAYRLGIEPPSIEVLTKISGVSFDEASAKCVRASVDGRLVSVVGGDELLRNERAAGRHEDLDDAGWLERNDEPKRLGE